MLEVIIKTVHAFWVLFLFDLFANFDCTARCIVRVFFFIINRQVHRKLEGDAVRRASAGRAIKRWADFGPIPGAQRSIPGRSVTARRGPVLVTGLVRVKGVRGDLRGAKSRETRPCENPASA